jgi:hypothetical protein
MKNFLKTAILTICFALMLTRGTALSAEEKKTEMKKDAVKAEKYEGYASNYEKKAEEAEKAGKTELAAIYKKCAEAKHSMAKAYKEGDKELLEEARKSYKDAKKELCSLKGDKNNTADKKKKSSGCTAKKKSAGCDAEKKESAEKK